MQQAINKTYADAGRPDLFGLLINGRRGRIFSTLYTAAGVGDKPTVILLHGIPGSEQNGDLARALQAAGFNALVFHYSGCFGSDGDYSLAHNIEDANSVLDFLLADREHGIDRDKIYAVGHSMGGFVCGQLSARRAEIRRAALLMPCDIGRLPQIVQEDPAAGRAIREVLDDSAGWLVGTSGEALWQEALEHSEDFRLENAAAALAKKPVLCIGGTLDIYTPPAMHCEPLARAVQAADGKLFQFIRCQTDHFFSDYRITVSETVSAFLKESLSE